MNDAPPPRRRLGGRILVGITLAAALAWLTVNLWPHSSPEPLWTEHERPAMPAAADNGFWPVTADELELDIPDPLQTIADPEELPAEQLWAEVEREAKALRAFLQTAPARTARERLEAARERPKFAADECLPANHCKLLNWHDVHRVAQLSALELALSGDSAGALGLLRDLIRMDLAHLETARTLLDFLIALDNLDSAMLTADALALRITGERATPEARAALVGLEAVIRTVDVEAVDLREIVVGEYVHAVELLEAVAAGESAAAFEDEIAGRPRWLYNHELTLRELNERFERRYASAVAGDHYAALGGGEPSSRDRFGWWLRNPVGALLLDAIRFESETIAADIDEHLATITRSQAAVLSRL